MVTLLERVNSVARRNNPQQSRNRSELWLPYASEQDALIDWGHQSGPSYENIRAAMLSKVLRSSGFDGSVCLVDRPEDSTNFSNMYQGPTQMGALGPPPYTSKAWIVG
jgi:hypothetical protein